MLNMLKFYHFIPVGETRRPLSNTCIGIACHSEPFAVILSEAKDLGILHFPAILELRPDCLVRQGAGHEGTCGLAL